MDNVHPASKIRTERPDKVRFVREEPRALTVDDFIRRYRIGRTKVYALINNGTLKSVMVGGRRLIPYDAAEALLNGEVA